MAAADLYISLAWSSGPWLSCLLCLTNKKSEAYLVSPLKQVSLSIPDRAKKGLKFETKQGMCDALLVGPTHEQGGGDFLHFQPAHAAAIYIPHVKILSVLILEVVFCFHPLQLLFTEI